MKKWLYWWFFAVGIVVFTYLGYYHERTSFEWLLVSLSCLFLPYYFIVRSTESFKSGYNQFVWMGIIFRCVFLAAIPELSDDFYRFLWDGSMLLNGTNPYTVLPESFNVGEHDEWKVLLDGVNSGGYYTLYPPLNQLIFLVGAIGFNHGLPLGVIALRVIIIIAELALLVIAPKVLHLTGRKKEYLLWYWLNPLVIVEVTGNLHFEGVTTLFLLLFIWFLFKKRWGWSAVAMSFAAGIKLVPLIFIPSLFRRVKFGWAVGLSVSTIGLLSLFYLPFISEDVIRQMGSSFDLYFRTFEFNAGLYFLVREICYQIIGWNAIKYIGPAMALLSALIILFIQWRKELDNNREYIKALQLSMFIYLLFATTVHPWYIVPLILLSVFTGRYYPLLWSALIYLSYGAYNGEQYHQNIPLVAAEYAILAGFVIYEFVSRKAIT